MFYFWGYTSAFVVYCALNYFWPEPATMIPATIFDDGESIEGAGDEASMEGPDEKKMSGVRESIV